jgi:hypothetical protein
MRYLITTPGHPPFFAAWLDPENHFAPGMAVYRAQVAGQRFTIKKEYLP